MSKSVLRRLQVQLQGEAIIVPEDEYWAERNALLRVARALEAIMERDVIYLGKASDLIEEAVEALREVEHLLD